VAENCTSIKERPALGVENAELHQLRGVVEVNPAQTDQDMEARLQRTAIGSDATEPRQDVQRPENPLKIRGQTARGRKDVNVLSKQGGVVLDTTLRPEFVRLRETGPEVKGNTTGTRKRPSVPDTRRLVASKADHP
jgi:hypothetical protein